MDDIRDNSTIDHKTNVVQSLADGESCKRLDWQCDNKGNGTLILILLL